MRQPSHIAALLLVPAVMLTSAFADEERPTKPLDPKIEGQLSSLFARLGSDDFVDRERAQRQLQELAGGQNEGILDRTFDKYVDSDDPEIRYRLRATMFDAIAAHIRQRGFIGIQMTTSFAIRRGGQLEQPNTVRVQYVIPGSAAERFGIQRFDEIIMLDGKPFDRNSEKEPNQQLIDYVFSRQEGDPLKITIRRGGVQKELDIELGAMPEALGKDRRENEFARWMHSEMVQRGLAKPEDAPPSSPQPGGSNLRVFPPQRGVPIPIRPENLFPEE